MTGAQPSPAPDAAGPHWDGCEHVHPGCAYRLGVAHGRAQATPESTPAADDLDDLDQAALLGSITDELGYYAD